MEKEGKMGKIGYGLIEFSMGGIRSISREISDR